MRILVVGGGSMGRRRLRDLSHLNPGGVILFEPDAGRCKQVADQFGVKGFTRFEEALAQKPACMAISTPPALHEQYVRAALQHGIHVFSELPFVLDPQSLAEISQTASREKIICGISGTIRFYPPYSLIRQLLREGRIGTPYYIEYSLGNHIADWHPYEDYRKFYASDMRQGGAGMDMILHELAPIQWWLGDIASVCARLTKVSNLEINGPDCHDVLLTFKSGCRGFFHHDIIERGTIGRHIRIVGEQGTLEWHQNQPSVRLFKGQTGQAEQISFDRAADWPEALTASKEMAEITARQTPASGKIPSSGAVGYSYESNYLREMKHFLEAAAGQHPYTLATIEEELKNVRVFHALVESSKTFKETAVEG